MPARRDKSLTSAWSTRADVSTQHFNYAHVYVYHVVWASVLHMPLRGVGGTVNQRRVRLQAASCASEMPCHLAPLLCSEEGEWGMQICSGSKLIQDGRLALFAEQLVDERVRRHEASARYGPKSTTQRLIGSCRKIALRHKH